MLQCTCGSLLLGHAITLCVTGFGPLQCDLSVLVSLQAASSHTRLRTRAHTDSQKEQLQHAGHERVCLVLGSVNTCMCLTALFNRASTHILRAFYSADIGIMNLGSPMDSVACCLMLVTGRPVSQHKKISFQLQLSQTQHVKKNCTETTLYCILRRGP